MPNRYFGDGQGHSKDLFFYVYGGGNHFSYLGPFKNLKITEGANKAQLYSLAKNVFVDIAYTGGTRLSNVLYQPGRTEGSIFDKEVIFFDISFCNNADHIKFDQTTNHHEGLLLGEQLVYVDVS